jgi:hypothetical protein
MKPLMLFADPPNVQYILCSLMFRGKFHLIPFCAKLLSKKSKIPTLCAYHIVQNHWIVASNSQLLTSASLRLSRPETFRNSFHKLSVSLAAGSWPTASENI